MDSTQSRDYILNKIATASKGRSAFVQDLEDSIVLQQDIYKPIVTDLLTCFVSELELVNGKVMLCENDSDLYFQLNSFLQANNIVSVFCKDKQILTQLESNKIPCSFDVENFTDMHAAVTGCEFLIARTGSVVVSSANESGRQLNAFPPIHIVVATSKQLVAFPSDALVAIHEKYKSSLPSQLTIITGPSRTADIEKTLVLGAHGPKEFIVFISNV